jgi:hypothetical protein
MLKVDQKTLEEMEKLYPGILQSILRFENAELPNCPYCGSADTADVQVGVIGRTTHIASATTKFKLLWENAPGSYFCNACTKFFGPPRRVSDAF